MKIKCKTCQYEWKTNSQMQWVTCPSCRNKTKKGENNEHTNKQTTQN